jgi:hypothetical protein
MVFTRRLREGVRRGRITCTVRIWKRLHVKVGGRYRLDDGHIVVDSIASMDKTDITDELARESGFDSAEDLLEIATHGGGSEVYLIRFHYLPAGAWDAKPATTAAPKGKTTLLQRIRRSSPPAPPEGRKQRRPPRPPRRRST